MLILERSSFFHKWGSIGMDEGSRHPYKIVWTDAVQAEENCTDCTKINPSEWDVGLPSILDTFVLLLLSAVSSIPQKMDIEARARDPLSLAHIDRASATLPPNLHFDPKMAGIAMVTLRHSTIQRHK